MKSMTHQTEFASVVFAPHTPEPGLTGGNVTGGEVGVGVEGVVGEGVEGADGTITQDPVGAGPLQVPLFLPVVGRQSALDEQNAPELVLIPPQVPPQSES